MRFETDERAFIITSAIAKGSEQNFDRRRQWGYVEPVSREPTFRSEYFRRVDRAISALAPRALARKMY